MKITKLNKIKLRLIALEKNLKELKELLDIDASSVAKDPVKTTTIDKVKEKTSGLEVEPEVGGTKVLKGAFNGHSMLGEDGEEYPVPANYASKSKMVEGDTLKLTITEDGSFVYKQIGPIDRKRVIGVLGQTEDSEYEVVTDKATYKVLLASVTYFKGEPGDKVAILLPKEGEASWAAIENIIKAEDNDSSLEAELLFADETSLDVEPEKVSVPKKEAKKAEVAEEDTRVKKFFYGSDIEEI